MSAWARLVALASALSFVGACSADVRIEDGEGDAGASGDDDSTGAGSTTGIGGGSGDTSGAGAGTTGDIEALTAACNNICTTRCIPTSPTCERDCMAVIDECVPEMLAVLECVAPGQTGPCPEEADPEACYQPREDLRRCQDVYFCGHSGHAEETVCTEENYESCDCTDVCDEGHTGRSRCHLEGSDEVCECWFDDVSVGECRSRTGSAQCRAPLGSCCNQLFR